MIAGRPLKHCFTASSFMYFLIALSLNRKFRILGFFGNILLLVLYEKFLQTRGKTQNFDEFLLTAPTWGAVIQFKNSKTNSLLASMAVQYVYRIRQETRD